MDGMLAVLGWMDLWEWVGSMVFVLHIVYDSSFFEDFSFDSMEIGVWIWICKTIYFWICDVFASVDLARSAFFFSG